MPQPPTDSVRTVSDAYFRYLGTHLPYQCASDEFYFMPRSEAAVKHLGEIDNLEPDRISGHLNQVRALLNSMPEDECAELETEIDRIAVRQSMERFLWQFEEVQVWKADPTLYTKLPLLAVDELISRTDAPAEEIRLQLHALLKQIPSFLEQGLANLENVSGMALVVAHEMACDCLNFFEQDFPVFLSEAFPGDQDLIRVTHEVCKSWKRFGTDLTARDSGLSFRVGEDGMPDIFSIGVNTRQSPDEALALAEEAFITQQEEMAERARRIDPTQPWQNVVLEQPSIENAEAGILELYRKEVERLRNLFKSEDLIGFPAEDHVEVLPTPSYLQSIRATASYRAPLTGRNRERGVFQITQGEGESRLISAHCSYLSAHETYPGHHVLDAVRLTHKNPIRRQLEAPLFYEGWSCYGETLLDELGYITDPRQKLVQLQRQLWRDLRAVLDVKLQTGRISMEQAANEIERLGFPPEVARRQVRRFTLTPGYQSCYFLGMREIVRLRDRFVPCLGLRGFHDALLSSGQIAFDLVEKRLEAEVERTRP
jgi:Bacterial protein of unknown function (DUF885)